MDVDERVPLPQRLHETLVGRLARRGHVEERVGDGRIGLVRAEQVGRHPVGHPQRPGQERAVELLELDQSARPQGAPLIQPVAAVPVGGEDAGQPESEPDAHPAAGDVVVEVAVVALEAVVDVGRHRRQEQLDVEVIELEALGELAQAEPGAARLGGIGRRFHVDPPLAGDVLGHPHPLVAEQGVDLLVAQVEAEERVLRRAVDGAASTDNRRHPQPDDVQPAEQVGDGRVPGLTHPSPPAATAIGRMGGRGA